MWLALLLHEWNRQWMRLKWIRRVFLQIRRCANSLIALKAECWAEMFTHRRHSTLRITASQSQSPTVEPHKLHQHSWYSAAPWWVHTFPNHSISIWVRLMCSSAWHHYLCNVMWNVWAAWVLEGWWFSPRVRSVGPFSKALNPTLNKHGLAPA